MRNKIHNILLEATAFKDRPNINDAFWEWFGNSPLRDSEGNPITYYHGTIEEFSSFSAIPEVEIGFPVYYFTSQPEYADVYTGMDSLRNDGKIGGTLLPVYINCKNIFDTRKEKHKEIYMNEMYKLGYKGSEIKDHLENNFSNNELPWWDNWLSYKVAHKNNFDGIFLQEREIFDSIGVFNPTQIKSIFNQGTWNPDNKDIMK